LYPSNQIIHNILCIKKKIAPGTCANIQFIIAQHIDNIMHNYKLIILLNYLKVNILNFVNVVIILFSIKLF